MQVQQLGEVVDLSTRQVITAFDEDPTGRKAAVAAFELLAARGCYPGRAELPSGSDPAEVLEQYGFGGVALALLGAEDRPLADWVVDGRIEPIAAGLHETTRNYYAAVAATKAISQLPNNQVWRQTDRVARRLDVSQHYVISLVGEAHINRIDGGGASARVSGRTRKLPGGDQVGATGADPSVAPGPGTASSTSAPSCDEPGAEFAVTLTQRGQVPLGQARGRQGTAHLTDPGGPRGDQREQPVTSRSRGR